METQRDYYKERIVEEERHIAIEISRKTGIPLKLAGKVNAMIMEVLFLLEAL